MEDSKVSHTDDNVNSMIADEMKVKIGKLSCTTGKKHTFIGMYIEFIVRKKVVVSTPHNVDKDLEDFGKIPKGNVVNPTTSQLFTINSEAKGLHDLKKG